MKFLEALGGWCEKKEVHRCFLMTGRVGGQPLHYFIDHFFRVKSVICSSWFSVVDAF